MYITSNTAYRSKSTGIRCLITFFFLVLSILSLEIRAEAAINEFSEELLSRGGLCLMIGGANEFAPAEILLESGPWIVHWLDADQYAVKNARRAFQERKVYGRISAEHWLLGKLPYADNMANVIVVNESEQPVCRDEVLRVLVPEGSAFIAKDNGFERLKKTRPEEMGEWTHPWQDPSGNPVSADRAFEPPNTFQWIAGPPVLLGGARYGHTGVVLSAGGRVFSVTHNVRELLDGTRGGPRYLTARDAFNGTFLWSRRWEGPTQGNIFGLYDAIVASGERVYGVHGNDIAVFDAATGEIIEVFPMDVRPSKLVKSDGILLAQTSEGLTALDVSKRKQIWHYEADKPWGVLVHDGRAFCLSSSRVLEEEEFTDGPLIRPGEWRHTLLAVDMNDGEELWRKQVQSKFSARGGGSGRFGSPMLRLFFAGTGFVCLVERDELRFLSAEDGAELWRQDSLALSRGRFDSRYVGHFLVDDKLWMRFTRASSTRDRGAPEIWQLVDPLTGDVILTRHLEGYQGVITNISKQGCQTLTATERFVLDARLSMAWEFETGMREGWKFARGGCRVGMIPANGLGYIPPNACGCLAEQLRGTLALVRTGDPGLKSFELKPLERGPAFGMELKTTENENSPDWPTYRRDGRRSAYLPGNIKTNLTLNWKSKICLVGDDRDGEWELNFGRSLSPPVIGNGLVVLAEPQSHRVMALNAADGEKRWHFTAGGRVTTPPTLYRGLALFGSHDGYVYALRSTDGELVWRFRAAPSNRRIMAYGQVESAWPVSGGVLVHEGVALVAAGRTVDGDGGVVVHALNPESGELNWTSRVQGTQDGDNEQLGAQHGKGDMLVTDGKNVYLMNKRLDIETGEIEEIGFSEVLVEREWTKGRAVPRVAYPEGVRYLRSGQMGFQSSAWTRIDMALRMHQSTWTWGEIDGEIIAFTDKDAFSFQINAGEWMQRAPRTDGGGRVITLKDNDDADWFFEISPPAQVESMLVADNVVFVAGPSNRSESYGSGFLLAIDKSNGGKLLDISLPIAPVFDGIAAAGGKVFAVLKDGSVVCFGAE